MIAEILSLSAPCLGSQESALAGVLKRELALFGVQLNHLTECGQNQGALQNALTEAIERSDMILAVGGIDPEQIHLVRRVGSAHPSSHAYFRSYPAGMPAPGDPL